MKKILSFILLGMLSIGTMWADTELVNIDFTTAEWSGKTFSQGNTSTPDEINGLYFYSKSDSKQFSLANNTVNGLTFPDNNASSNNYLFAIPLSSINGSITLIVTHSYDAAKASFKYAFVAGETTFPQNVSISFKTDMKDANNADTQMSMTISTGEATTGMLYLGRNSSNYTKLNSVIVTTPVPASIPGDITFSPATGASVNAGSSITLSAEGATTYKYKWTNSSAEPADGWSEGSAATVPEYGSENTYLHAYGVNAAGDGTKSFAQYTIIAPKVATPVLPTSCYFVESKSISITCATEEAFIVYSTDNGVNWMAYSSDINLSATTTIQAKATKSGYSDSEIASATYTKVVFDEQTDVTGSAVWDWSTLANAQAIELSAPFVNYDAVFSTFANYGYAIATIPSSFNQEALLVNTQYIYRDANDSKFMQGSKVQFTTTIPGIVTIEYANTGGNPKRTVVVNNVRGTKTSSANNSYQTESFSVAAGDVIITGVQTETVSGKGNDGDPKMLRIRKVVFTPTEITLGEGGYSTFAAPFKYTVSGASVYKAAANDGKTAVVLTEVPGAVVPANAGIVLKGTAGATATIAISDAEKTTLTGNELVGVVTPITAPANSYVIATFEDGTKFNPCGGALVIPTHKAYIVIAPAQGGAPSAIRIEFAENNATDIKSVMDSEKAVKFMENGKLYIQKDGVVYDATGAKVK